MIGSRRVRGVSLLEALVAMAVMAFGAVAVVGLQATLRGNSDLAKQRSEAMRLASEKIEEWRGIRSFVATPGVVDWTDIASANEIGIVRPNANTTYNRDTVVVETGGGAANPEPLSKRVHVRVTWQDRTGQQQEVSLNTVIAGVHPELGGTLSVTHKTSPLRNPDRRHPAVPRAAIDQGDGTSRFSPPGAGPQVWVFSNTTGMVVQYCSDAVTCSDIRAMLLHGFVRFSTGFVQPTVVQAESPTSAALPIAVVLNQTSPFITAVDCFEAFSATAVEYFCLVEVNIVTTNWSGTTAIAGINLAGDIDDDHDNRFKVCRYTAVRSNAAVVPADLKNIDHPLHYVAVDTSLTNQNFLVIRAGDDDDPFVCPNDNPATTDVNTATWYHQPSN